eukprot:TRINITY_DN98034_c0_g1_i1.p1 TRINITY_DN98034_c0_g1~~TRINITY_DN98034_c0_g1_i1.p1  ORF type:complete len:195 (-),score=13.76 TRINITY_DN98034_c0_g1_i1:27-611(-)
MAGHVEMGEYSLAVGATVAYFFMWYGFLCQQMQMRGVAAERASKQRTSFSRFDYRFAEWEMADRTILNTQEQMVAFLLPMWLYAVFCNARVAGVLGIVYVAFRCIYPILWSIHGRFTLLVELSTQPCYLVQGWYLVSLLYTAVSGDLLEPQAAWLWPLYLLGAWAVFMIASWGAVGGTLFAVNKHLMSQSGELD